LDETIDNTGTNTRTNARTNTSNNTRLPMQIIHEDSDLIIINKPAGLLTVPGLVSPENAFDKLLRHHPNSRVVHRLDMATSGLVIFAQNHASQKQLGKLFENRSITKHYTAVVEGLVKPDTGEIASPLLCDWENRPRQIVEWYNGKHAHTFFKVLARNLATNQTRLLLKPFTGRSHQLRVHCQQIGHAITGDTLYSSPEKSAQQSRMLLHASRLLFTHPINHTEMDIRCEPTF